jgi:RecA/RadA recombinase
MQESTAQLQHAIDKVHLRFGEQALLRATRLPPAEPWPSGLAEVDRLTGIRGLPKGRLSVLQGPTGSGKLTLALSFLARATRELAQSVVIDHRVGFDPWPMAPMNPDLRALALVKPPDAATAGEAAVALARAGAGFLLLLGELPENALAPLESAAARSGSLVVACANARDAALAHASSLTLGLEHAGWLYDRDQLVGLRTQVTCLKNKLAAPGAATELEIRYPLGATRFPDKPLAIVFNEGVKPWVVRTAVG